MDVNMFWILSIHPFSTPLDLIDVAGEMEPVWTLYELKWINLFQAQTVAFIFINRSVYVLSTILTVLTAIYCKCNRKLSSAQCHVSQSQCHVR